MSWRSGTVWPCATWQLWLRRLLCTGALALLLTGAPQGAAAPAGRSPVSAESASQGLSAPPAHAGSGAMAAQPGQDDSTATQLPGGRKDLTVFFSAGVIADLLLVAAFVVWAVRQWRKTR